MIIVTTRSTVKFILTMKNSLKEMPKSTVYHAWETLIKAT
jgi:hypothetical protein